MKKPFSASLVLGLFMIVFSALAMLMKPTAKASSAFQKPDLSVLIPAKFGAWRVDPSSNRLMVDPEVRAAINEIYDQMLLRTYVNSMGQRVMLSIAYGSDQSTDLQIHRPEICYRVSGFSIDRIVTTSVDTGFGPIPVIQMVARRGRRNEPVTYWIRVGDSLTAGWFGQKLVTFRYLVNGIVPDGLLFRLSTISDDEQESFQTQRQFLMDLLASMPRENRFWLVGRMLN
jgi:EpsI family protein